MRDGGAGLTSGNWLGREKVVMYCSLSVQEGEPAWSSFGYAETRGGIDWVFTLSWLPGGILCLWEDS